MIVLLVTIAVVLSFLCIERKEYVWPKHERIIFALVAFWAIAIIGATFTDYLSQWNSRYNPCNSWWTAFFLLLYIGQLIRVTRWRYLPYRLRMICSTGLLFGFVLNKIDVLGDIAGNIVHWTAVIVWLKLCIDILNKEFLYRVKGEIVQPSEFDLRLKKYLDTFNYHLMFALWYVVACIPFFVLYFLSDVISAFLFHVVRYRRKVVHKNLTDSFPGKSAKEIYKVERRYYQHFCDLLMESLKYFSISEKSLRKRLVYKNLEQARESLKNGKTIGLYMGHYGNWEWVSSLPLAVGDVSQCCQLYHPLENKVMDRLVAYTRERWGGVNIPAAESIRHIIKLKQQGKPLVIGFIADQVPLWQNIHYWTRFLNHEYTPVFTGAERLMKKLDMDVYYLDVRKVKRGHYEAEFKLISSTPNECEDFYLTEQYTRMLEQTINEAPPYWLWSHKRWKRTIEEYRRLFGDTQK